MNDTNTKFYEELKKQRNVKKISLEEISEYTKINVTYLDAIENGDFHSLPNVYSRLFLRSYCKYIGADYKKVLDDYEMYTIGNKSKKDVEINANQNKEQIPSSPIQKSNLDNTVKKTQNYKELIIATTVIVIIIILFIILNLLNK